MFDLYIADQERLTETNSFPDSQRCVYEAGKVVGKKTYECKKRGRYVVIRRRTSGHLTLCEIQVWAK